MRPRAKLALPGREVVKEIPYAPPTPPSEELPGDHVTEEMVKEWPQDKFRRSKWKTNGPSVRAWAELEEEHEKNRNHPIPVDDWMEPGFYAFNSVMGSGKTAVAAHKAKLHYSAGWPVFHTGAFKFGNYIRRGELYHFSDALPAGPSSSATRSTPSDVTSKEATEGRVPRYGNSGRPLDSSAPR